MLPTLKDQLVLTARVLLGVKNLTLLCMLLGLLPGEVWLRWYSCPSGVCVVVFFSCFVAVAQVMFGAGVGRGDGTAKADAVVAVALIPIIVAITSLPALTPRDDEPKK